MATVQDVGAISRPRFSYFLLRRLHSFTGLFPIGVYVFFHLTANFTMLLGPEKYQFSVDQIHNLHKLGLLLPVELVFIFIPLAFHGILGLIIWFSGQSNAMAYREGSNVRYTLQRITGGIAFIFILFHVWQMHRWGAPLGGGIFDPTSAPATAAAPFTQGWTALVYAIGVIATVFHLANGIWTALITWGITISPSSQRVAGYLCTAFGIFLGVIGLLAIVGFRTYDSSRTPNTHNAEMFRVNPMDPVPSTRQESSHESSRGH